MKRKIDETVKKSLMKSSLWENNLKRDCEEQKVFLAIRDNRIDFYHKGGKLFGFDNKGFKTHKKYAAVIDSKTDYLTEADLNSVKLITGFESVYNSIKENCSLYSGVEAQGVSKIYHNHSYLSSKDTIVLDIEISFESKAKGKKQDRIDILLLNKKTQTLLFVEAKHFSNGEIWSTDAPKVKKQLEVYEEQILERKKEILKEYSNYIDEINSIFNLSIPKPIDIQEKVALFIFGFDANQRDGRLKELIKKNPAYKGIKCYSVGDEKNITDLEKTIWEAKVL